MYTFYLVTGDTFAHVFHVYFPMKKHDNTQSMFAIIPLKGLMHYLLKYRVITSIFIQCIALSIIRKVTLVLLGVTHKQYINKNSISYLWKL